MSEGDESKEEWRQRRERGGWGGGGEHLLPGRRRVMDERCRAPPGPRERRVFKNPQLATTGFGCWSRGREIFESAFFWSFILFFFIFLPFLSSEVIFEKQASKYQQIRDARH